MRTANFTAIPEAIQEIRSGRMLILADHPSRENEGDFFMPAQSAKVRDINFMLHFGRGLLCTAITSAAAARLGISLMVPRAENKEKTKVNFGISVNARRAVTTGVSADDRARTIRVLANPKSQPEDLVSPGHVMTLIARDRGLLAREGHTEAAVTLAALAGFTPAGVLCEILRDDGKMARRKDLLKLSQKFKIKIVSIPELVKYLKKYSRLTSFSSPSVVKTAFARLPTSYGNFRVLVYKSSNDRREHAVLIRGKVKAGPILVRIHSQCLTGDTFFSLKCDCREQLQKSLEIIQEAGSGAIIYLNQEGRGIGLSNKIKAYALQERGFDTVQANKILGFAPDEREYDIAADILRDLGITEVILLTNNPEKPRQLLGSGIKVTKSVPLEIPPNKINSKYLEVKKRKLGHQIFVV